jgi:hypothetical protein
MRIRTCCAAIALVLTMIAAAGAAEALDVKRYMPLSEIEPGMAGVGKTTLVGTNIVEFQVKVLAVIKRVGPERDLIIVRCSGAGLEESGIIAGMSGSPIYIGGRLIGALAYSFSYAKLPIAGVQPIEQMLRVTERPGREAAAAANAAAPSSAGNAAADSQPGADASVAVPVAALGLARLPAALAGREMCEMTAIKAPVMVAGMAAGPLSRLRDELAPLGLVPMAGGGGGADIKLPASSILEPGAPLAISMVRGDTEVTTMGTITEITGDRLYGFGHGMLNLGEADYPLMTGVAHVVIPTLTSSFRLGAPVREVGRLVGDEETAVLGRLSKDRAPMIPMTFKITGPAKDHTKTYHYEMVHQTVLTPMLASNLIASSLTHQSELPRDHTITYRITVRPVGEKPIVRENVVASPAGDLFLELQVRSLVVQLLQNQFHPIKIESIDVEATIEPVSRLADLEDVRPLRNTVRPGGTVPVEVRIRPYHADPLWIVVNVAVPADYPEGTVRATLCGGDEAMRQESREVPVRVRPDSAATLLAALARQQRRDQLFIRLESPGDGVAIGSDELPNLPASMRSVLSDSARREVSPVKEARVTNRAVPYVLQGSRTIELKVDRKAPEQ